MIMDKRLSLLVLLAIMFLIGQASATCSGSQVGSSLYIGNCTSISQLNASVNNVSVLQNLGSGEWLLNANLINNNTTNTFYINNSDVTWLKINSTNALNTSAFNITTFGKLEINNTKITSWNTTSQSTEDLDENAPAYGSKGRGYLRAIGSLAFMNISNSNISYLGNWLVGLVTVYGLTYDHTNISGSIIDNSTFINNYALMWQNGSANDTIKNSYIRSNYSRLITSYWAGGESKYIKITGNRLEHYPLPFFTTWEIIDINGDGNNISDNIITGYGTTNTVSGLRIRSPGASNFIHNNTISNYGAAMSIESNDNIISDNNLTSNGRNTLIVTGVLAINNTFINDTYIKAGLAFAPVSIENQANNNTFDNISVITSVSYKGFSVQTGSTNKIINSRINNSYSTGFGLYLDTGITRIFINNTIINASGVNGDAVFDNTGGSLFNNSTLIGKRNDLNITSGTDSFIDSIFNNSKVNLSGTGRMDIYHYLNVNNVNHSLYNQKIYGSEGTLLSNTFYSLNLNTVLIKEYQRTSSIWTNLTPQHFEINNTNAGKEYNISRNGVVSQFVFSSPSGLLIFNEPINATSITISLENTGTSATNPPSITSWLNNYTNNNDLIITDLNQSKSIKFSVVSNQSVIYDWYLDGVWQVNNYDNLTTSWSSLGTYLVNVSVRNSNGTSAYTSWNVTVVHLPIGGYDSWTIGFNGNESWDASNSKNLNGRVWNESWNETGQIILNYSSPLSWNFVQPMKIVPTVPAWQAVEATRTTDGSTIHLTSLSATGYQFHEESIATAQNWSAEARILNVNSSGSGTAFQIGDSYKTFTFRVQNGNISAGSTPTYFALNTSNAYHTYRLNKTFIGGIDRLEVYIDDNQTPSITTTSTSTTTLSKLDWGDLSSTVGNYGEAYWDYLLWNTSSGSKGIVFFGNGNLTLTHDSENGNETGSISANFTTFPTNTNATVTAYNNLTGDYINTWSSITSNYWNAGINTTQVQNLKVNITLYGNLTDTPRIINFTFNTQPKIPNPVPIITSWGNNKTNDNTTTLRNINQSETVNFNATANQAIITWNWSVNGIDQSWNYSNFNFSNSTPDWYIIQGTGTNSNGTSIPKEWAVQVNETKTYIGMQWTETNLGGSTSDVLNTNSKIVAYRFTAQETKSVKNISVLLYNIINMTGVILNLGLMNDSDGLPSGTYIQYGNLTNVSSDSGSGSGNWNTAILNNYANLSVGYKYWIILKWGGGVNLSTNNNTLWILNGVYNNETYQYLPNGSDGRSLFDAGLLYARTNDSISWTTRNQSMPGFVVEKSDGIKFGNVLFHSSWGVGNTSGADHSQRQIFKVYENKSVNAIQVWGGSKWAEGATTGTNPGSTDSLQYNITNYDTGEVLVSTRVLNTTSEMYQFYNDTYNTTGGNTVAGQYRWLEKTLPSTLNLTSGTTYDIRITCSGCIDGEVYSLEAPMIRDAKNLSGIYTMTFDGNSSWWERYNSVTKVWSQDLKGADLPIRFKIGEINIFNYIPPTPVIGMVTTGNFWKNISWTAGSGNVTDSYNVSRNGTWYNGTSSFLNTTTVSHGQINDTIYAFNSSGSGTLSAEVTNNTQIPNNPVTIINVSSNYTLYAGQSLLIDANFTDADDTSFFNEVIAWYDNSSVWDITVWTGQVNWATNSLDVGMYNWYIKADDNYGDTDQINFTVTVKEIVVEPVPIQVIWWE